MSQDGEQLTNKTSFRILNTLYNMGKAPEPNITVMWSPREPEAFRKFVAKVAVDTSAIQVENDDLLRDTWGTDYYGIACCVSAQPIATGVQFFGARANLAKAVLYAINGGVDEKTRMQVGPEIDPIETEYIDYDTFMKDFDKMADWLAGLYVNSLNVIHYSHDQTYYEKASMALKNTNLDRSFATGISGFSHAVDSISAIKYGHVRIVRDDKGFPIDYVAENEFPKYGNNDDRADEIATWLVEYFFKKMDKHKKYRGAKLTTSILTITSNVVVRTER